ncbi:MAG: PilW family protein [Gammaproteobacteria bacterium]
MIKHQKGMSLAELMIAMALGLMLTLGIATLFTQTRQSFNQDEQIATMQANLRFAIEVVVADATMAGFWGGVLEPISIENDSTLSIANDCGVGAADWAYDLSTPINGVDNATAAAAAAAFDCIDADEFRATTDVLAIKRVRGLAIEDNPNQCVHDFNATDTLVDNTVYLADNGITGLLFAHPASGAIAVGGCVENREYAPTVHYIRNFSTDEDDGIPTLCRKVMVMGVTPTMTTECLVEGIEQLQIEYGVDANSDGLPERYLSAPTAAQWPTVTAIRIHLLARSLRPEQGYLNPKAYVLGNTTVTPADNFYRRSATTTVLLRNPANLRNLGRN